MRWTVFLIFVGLSGAAELPDGTGKELVAVKCVGCHALGVVTDLRASHDEARPRLHSRSSGRSRRPKVVGRHAHDYYLLDLDDIFAFQADGEIVWILTAKRKLMATQTLQSLEDRLGGSQFQRVHRSVLVNADKIRKLAALSSQRWLITLTNGLEFTVSKRQAPVVRELLR